MAEGPANQSVPRFGRWELMTGDAAGAEAFYRGIWGWEAETEEFADGAKYTHLWTASGQPIGGLYPMAAELAAHPASAHWTPFLLVDDVDQALGQAKTLGAFTTTESFFFADRGQMALIQDPTGAPLGLWHSALSGTPAADFAWHELSTNDAGAAAGFYHALCRWHLSQDSQGPINYRLFTDEARLMAGMLALGPRYQTVPSHWLPYFRVADVAGTAAAITRAGGRLLAQPTAGGLGLQAVAQDPQGAVFGIMAQAAELQ